MKRRKPFTDEDLVRVAVGTMPARVDDIASDLMRIRPRLGVGDRYKKPKTFAEARERVRAVLAVLMLQHRVDVRKEGVRYGAELPETEWRYRLVR